MHARPLTIACLTLLAIVSLPAALSAQPPPPRPFLMAHYMPWFQAKPYQATWGWHWTMNHYNPDLIDGLGRRNIASHYYPLIGPYDSRDPDVTEYHALLMKVAGIDGAIVDWNGYSSLYDYPLGNIATLGIFNALSAAGLRFAICYEDQSIAQQINNGRITPAQAVGQAQFDMQYIIDHWSNKPAYLTLDGKPVLLNFGPQYFYAEADWASILSVYSGGAQFYPLNDRLGTVAAGAFPWPPMWLTGGGVLTPEMQNSYLDNFHSIAASWPSFVSGAWPGFYDIYQEAGVQPSYGFLDARGGLTFSETTDRALAASPEIIQLVTWNDFGEGTNIEPTQEFGFQYLEHVQDVARGFGTFPFAAGDLTMPYDIFSLRKSRHGDAAAMAGLNQAAGYLVSGQPAQARSVLNGLVAVEPGQAASQLSVQVWPNPAAMRATVRIELPAAGDTQVEVFDTTGRRVDLLASAFHDAGQHSYEWDTSRHPSGIYLVRLKTGASVATRKVLLQR
ncbi:MAG: endo-1,3-alpha-glucanase family glycosylhydrolase [Candidatus Eiseniibacteriota bacterium]